jgi:hypothetical protein
VAPRIPPRSSRPIPTRRSRDPMPETTTTTVELGERNRVILHRYTEARTYGLTKIEARLYAESEISASELRRLKRVKCPPAVAAKILL